MRIAVGLLVLVPTLVFAATPPEGVPLQVRRGFFTETALGAFATVGGADGYSNAETYLQLGIGYDLSNRFEVDGSFGLGSSGSNCLTQRDSAGLCETPDSFTLSFFDVSAAYLYPLKGRLFLTPRLAAGYTRLDPAPRYASSGMALRSGLNLGTGIGLEYATAMDHFSIGADLMFRYVLHANVATFALYPRIKYTF